MKTAMILGLSALALAACKTDDDMARRMGPNPMVNAQKDHAFCLSIGVDQRHPHYSECRYEAARRRTEKAEAERRKLLKTAK